EHLPFKQRVAGSIPARLIKKFPSSRRLHAADSCPSRPVRASLTRLTVSELSADPAGRLPCEGDALAETRAKNRGGVRKDVRTVFNRRCGSAGIPFWRCVGRRAVRVTLRTSVDAALPHNAVGSVAGALRVTELVALIFDAGHLGGAFRLVSMPNSRP